MGKIILEEQTGASTPASNKVAIYPKAGGGVYKKADDGVESLLATTDYVDTGISGVDEHSEMLGLTIGDDHTQYSLADGTRAFTGVVGGITPVADTDLTTKLYTDDAITTATGALTITADHNGLLSIQGGDTNEYYHLNVHEDAQLSATTDTAVTLGVAGDGNARISIDSVTQTVNITSSGTGTDIDLTNTEINLSPEGAIRGNFALDVQTIGDQADTDITISQANDSIYLSIANTIEMTVGTGGMNLKNSTISVNDIQNTADADSINVSSTDAQLATAKLTYNTITSAVHTRSHAMTSTSDHTAGNWKVVYTDGSGNVTELPLGVSGTVLTSQGAGIAPIFV